MAGGIPVVTIDGPSGSGKGTVARRVAAELGYHLLDSGAIYRLLALAAGRAGVALDDEAGLVRVAGAMRLAFSSDGDDPRAWLDGDDVTDQARTEACGDQASQVAALPAVRKALLQRQRDFLRPPGLVADGRDMGTVVFPDAEVKIFLTASAGERARRRHKQLKEQGVGVNLPTLLEEIEARDRRDAERPVSPLVPAEGSVPIDTTGLSVEAVVDRVLSQVRRRVDR
jgi:cytidylate kinase